ncbi:MAG: cysteine rich repeat-containing protein [Gammaproteobacteria bacterium]
MLFSISAHAEQAGKPLAEKLQEGDLIITSSVSGCDEDIKQHCDGLGDNQDKVFMCLAAYEEHLSSECKQGILEAALSIKMGAAALDYSISACEADADKHCLDVQPGEGRLVSCIKANESRVSKDCITALKETGLWELGKQ